MDNVNFSIVAIEKTLSEASDTHSSGPDGISVLLLKRLKSSVSLPLSFIYHFSYENGTIPEARKNSIVCPVYCMDLVHVQKTIDQLVLLVSVVRSWSHYYVNLYCIT